MRNLKNQCRTRVDRSDTKYVDELSNSPNINYVEQIIYTTFSGTVRSRVDLR